MTSMLLSAPIFPPFMSPLAPYVSVLSTVHLFSSVDPFLTSVLLSAPDLFAFCHLSPRDSRTAIVRHCPRSIFEVAHLGFSAQRNIVVFLTLPTLLRCRHSARVKGGRVATLLLFLSKFVSPT